MTEKEVKKKEIVKKAKKSKVSDYAWVVRGSQKRKIIVSLDEPKIPTQIKNDTDLSLNNVSDVLREFRKRELVELENPEEKTGRIYKLTSKGLKVRERVAKYGEKKS